jgi:hypothetical protein
MANDRYAFPDLQWQEIFRSHGLETMTQQLKQHLHSGGPLSFGIYANSPFMSYASGIFSGSCTAGANHEVVAIGYGSNYILGLNSWGSSWGEEGRFKCTPCTVTDFTLVDWDHAQAQVPSPLISGSSPAPPTPGTTAAPVTTAAPTPAGPWSVTSGPCVRDGAGCVTSDGWTESGSIRRVIMEG